MKQLVIYTNWKHDDENEWLRINLDILLTDKNKGILFQYLKKCLEKDYDLTYVTDSDSDSDTNDKGNYILTMDEFELMLNTCLKGNSYYLGENKNTYLFPVGVRIIICDDNSLSLCKIKMLHEMDKAQLD